MKSAAGRIALSALVAFLIVTVTVFGIRYYFYDSFFSQASDSLFAQDESHEEIEELASSPSLSQEEVKIMIDDVLLEGRYVFLLFYKSWCPYSQEQLEIVQEIKEDYKSTITFFTIDAELHVEIAQWFDVSLYPTMFFIIGKEEGEYLFQSTLVGLTDKSYLCDLFDSILYDECPCLGDVTGDGTVDIEDLLVVLASWGTCYGCPADVTNDNVVNEFDIIVLLTNWGPCNQTTNPSACSDGMDNDEDGKIDFPEDPGCEGIEDNNETDPEEPSHTLPACSDDIDNDGDELIDYPQDPGCEDAEDDNESDAIEPPEPPLPACSDGVDNDSDGLIDYPEDPGCESLEDNNETNPVVITVCSDGLDNDGDGLIDYPEDPGCESLEDTDEFNMLEGEHYLFVSPQGSDENPGTFDQPFLTLTRARNELRNIKEVHGLETPYTIILREGTYYLGNTFEIRPEDSGTETCLVTYQSYPGEEVSLSGGHQLEVDWEPYTDTIYVADLPNGLTFNSLYVDGQRALRARTPNPDEEFPYHMIKSVDYTTRYDAFRFYEGDIDSTWINLQDVEVVSMRRWKQTRFRIDHIEGTDKVYFEGRLPDGKGYNWDYDSTTGRYYVENVFEGLDSPGEWYLDTSTSHLYYWPESGEDINESTFISPITNVVLYLNGLTLTSEQWSIRYVRIKDLIFEHTDWILPEGGYAGSYIGSGTPGSYQTVRLENCEHIIFEGNTIRNTGTYGLRNHNIRFTQIIDNEMYALGSGGIMQGGVVFRSVEISNNEIHNFGKIYMDGVGIDVVFKGDQNRISYNHIYNCGYIGIVSDAPDVIVDRDNRIEYNHIHNIMQILNDGGGMHIGGFDDTLIQYNKIHDILLTNHHIHDHVLAGIYPDEQGNYKQIKNNVVYRAYLGLIIHRSNANIVENNIFVDCEKFFSFPRRNESIPGNTLERNIVYSTSATAQLFGVGAEPSMNNVDASDYNLFYTEVPSPNWNLEWWKSTWPEFDQHSLEIDPLFVDYEHDNFILQPSSPAWSLGFEQITLG